MLGAIIGDIVGSRWEFNPTNDYDFELFSGENGFTDDTICTVAVADALLKGRDYGDSIHDWCRRYPYPMGGNGSAMRVSPIGMWFNDREKLLEQARLSAACSHNDPEGIKGAQTVALAVHMAYKLRDEIHYDIAGMKELMAYATGFSKYDINIRKEDVENRFDETCQGTVPVALWVIYNSKSFEDSIRRAVSLGADADTLGAIVGGIAEAIWGIPEWMKEKALSFLPDDMKSVVTAFYEYITERSVI